MFDVWKNVLAEVEQKVSHAAYNTWFPGAGLEAVEGEEAIVRTPSVFIAKQLETKYNQIILEALQNNNIKVTRVKYIVQNKNSRMHKAGREVVEEEEPKRRGRPRKVEKVARRKTKFQSGLNPRYTMANFVVGSNNDLAVSVARNVIKEPGTKSNPFFLYGGPGLGKTHLVQAIGNEILHNDPEMRVLYIPIHQFYSDFISAIKANKADDFSARFKNLDVLIVDDFQMIVNKDRSQEEFFNIFNDLHQLNKQIIVTSDRLPDQIEKVDQRLASRLTWGGAIDLQMPNFEDKCAILKSKAEFQGIEIEDAAIEYLAENVKTNIRDLEGEFSHLMAVADWKEMSPLEVINDGLVQPHATSQQRRTTPGVIVEKVAKTYHITSKELKSKSRVSQIKNARQVAMYLLQKELAMSTQKIAMEVGVKDHTTVMHGIKKIENDLKLNFGLREQIASIREELYD